MKGLKGALRLCLLQRSTGRGMKVENITEKSCIKDINSRRHPSAPGISSACKKGNHCGCSKSNCTCDCGHHAQR